jgi:hypothetical protein
VISDNRPADRKPHAEATQFGGMECGEHFFRTRRIQPDAGREMATGANPSLLFNEYSGIFGEWPGPCPPAGTG